MRNGYYLFSGATVGIAAASFLILMPADNSMSSAGQNLIFTAQLDQAVVLNPRADRNDGSSSERDIRVILASPYANVTANKIR